MKRYLVTLTAIGAMAATLTIAQTTSTTTAPSAPVPVKTHLQRQLIKALDLTAAQKQQARTILQATRQQAQPLAAQIKLDRESLTAAIQAGDTAKIQQISTAMGTLQGQVLAIRSAGKAQFYALLTPDQKTKAVEFEQKARDVPGAKGE